MNKSQILKWCDKIAFILLCILMCDCCVFGAGRFLSFGAISYRMILLALVLIASVPVLLSRWKEIIKNKYVVMVLLFGFWMIVATIIGVLNENRTSLIATDIKGFMYFALLPAAVCIITNKDRLQTLMKAMMYASAVSGILLILSLCMFLGAPEIYAVINKALSSGMIASFSIISPKLPRMFFKSVMYLLCGCAFSVYFQAKSEKKFKIHYVLITAVSLFGMFMTFTRSVYLGAFFAALGTVVFLFIFGNKTQRKNTMIHLGGSVALFLAIVLTFSAISDSNYLKFAIMRSVASENVPADTEDESSEDETDTEDSESETLDEDDYQEQYIEITIKSDKIREETLRGLYRNISKSPIIGIGLGAEFPERPTGLNEYFYLDLWSKGGIIGLGLYLAPILLMLRTIIKRFKQFTMNHVGALLSFSILVGFLAFSWFNPYMNAALGIIFYCCVIGMFSYIEKEFIEEDKRNGNLAVVISATHHYEERAKSVISEYEKSHKVLYITSDFAHIPKKPFVCDVPNSIQLHVIPYYKNLSVSRILSHIVFSAKTFWLLKKLKPVKVYVEIPNNTLATATAMYKSMYGCELIFDIFDMWPEALPVKSKNPLFVLACKVWGAFRNRALKKADQIYVECEYFKELIQGQGYDYPMEVHYLKRPGNDLPYKSVWKEDQIDVCYVGSINNIVDIPLMIEVITKLGQKRKVCFHVIGTGEAKDRLCAELKDKDNVTVKEYGVVYDVQKLQDIFNESCFGINFLLPDLAIGITMKSVTYLQGALPLLNTVDGDTRRYVNERNIGINVDRDNIDGTIEQILSLSQKQLEEMKANAKDIFKEVFEEHEIK